MITLLLSDHLIVVVVLVNRVDLLYVQTRIIYKLLMNHEKRQKKLYRLPEINCYVTITQTILFFPWYEKKSEEVKAS